MVHIFLCVFVCDLVQIELIVSTGLQSDFLPHKKKYLNR